MQNGPIWSVVLEPAASEPAPDPPLSRGLGLLRDIIVHPQRAFVAIAARGEWLPAYLATVAIELVSLYLIAPAVTHLTALQARSAAAGHAAAGAPLPAAYDLLARVGFTLILPLAVWGFVATLLTATTLGRGERRPNYSAFLALGLTCAFVSTFGDLIEAICVRLRDPASFASPAAVLLAAPITLASLRPAGSDLEVSFLAFWDPTRLWAALLFGYGIAALTNMRLTIALFLALSIAVSLALLQT